MTERTLLAPSHIAQSHPVSPSFVADPPKSTLVPVDSVDDGEEPYTIKCICDYADDDGNTIYCESCDTWQHIDCFYHGNAVEASRDDFSHFCADCKPRPLDRRKAHERQRLQREERLLQVGDERKVKRGPSKSHKRKTKQADGLANGSLDSHGAKASSHDPAHIKKVKSHHRSQQSISSKRSPSTQSRNASHAHPPSPAATPPDLPPNFSIHSYSSKFREICQSIQRNDERHDHKIQDVDANSYANLSLTNTMSVWLQDPEKLKSDTGANDYHEVFQIIKDDIQYTGYPWPILERESNVVSCETGDITIPYLVVRDPRPRGVQAKGSMLVGELKGFIGFQRDYTQEEKDSYTRLCHPEPFVFFHPSLPLYIDTRREGSICRYARRSCRSNTTLETYITNHREYHFCLVADGELHPNEPITLPWDFRFPKEVAGRYLALLGLRDNDFIEPASDDEYDRLSELITNVLSEYGGCACGLGNNCVFVRFHRDHRAHEAEVHAETQPLKPKKSRKPKHVSPTAGNATGSRDASEGRLENYDAEDDSRSTTGSVKPRSRDLTPMVNGLDNGDGVSERDKRKLADIEKTFEHLEKAPPRKKKRNSDGHVTVQTKQKQKSVSKAVSTATHGKKDKSLSRHHSDSPTTGVSPRTTAHPGSQRPSRQASVAAVSRPMSPVHGPTYVESSTQTDPVADAWYSTPPRPRKKFVPLARRLIENQRKMWALQESRRKAWIAQVSQLEANKMEGVEMTGAGLVSSHVGSSPIDASHQDAPSPTEGKRDARQGANASTENGVASPQDSMVKPPVPAWPGAASASSAAASTDPRIRDLTISMPTAPFMPNGLHGPPLGTPGSYPPLYSPLTPLATMVQSPLGTNYPAPFAPSGLNSAAPNPPPLKKKMSLSAYNALKKKHPEQSSTPKTNSIDVSALASKIPSISESKEGSTPKGPTADDVKENAQPVSNGIPIQHTEEKVTSSTAAV